MGANSRLGAYSNKYGKRVMIPKYDLSDFIFMVTALVFHQHASKRPRKNLFCRHERLLREKKRKKKEIGKKNKTKQNKTKINVLNCFARAANTFRSEFVDKKYGKLAGHTLVKWSKPSLTLERCILMRNVTICLAI